MALSCTVCDHPQRQAIDSLIAVGIPSQRVIARQFNLHQAAIDRHKRNGHLGKQLAKAIEKKEQKEADIFLDRHEHLYRESLQYIEDAKLAVKMQKVTAEVEENGKMTLQDRYQEFRDVGAMAPALGAATALQRLLGDATQRFSQPSAGTGVNVHLSVILPRAIEPGQQPAIDITPALPPAEE